MVGGRVFTAVPGNGLFNGIVIRAIFFMQGPVQPGLAGIAKLRIDKPQVVMCCQVFRINFQRLLKPGARLLQQYLLLRATLPPKGDVRDG